MIQQLNVVPELELTLDQLKKGEKAWVSRLTGPEDRVRRLMELGILEKAPVQIAFEAPFGKDPIALKVRGGLLALRRSEARMISVQRVAPL